MRLETPEETIKASGYPRMIAGGVAAEGMIFRLICQTTEFVAVKVYEHPVAGPCVHGVTEDFTRQTHARVTDVVFSIEGRVPQSNT